MLCVLAAPKAKADDWNRKTVITFSGPVEVPGVGVHLLPAGTYVFKILQSAGNLHIVQISNQDETHVFTTVLAIANFRLKTTDKTVITFSERPAGEPEAIKAWFYPGRELGEQFVYEKPRAIELAKETNEIVLSTPVAFATTPVESLSTVPIQAVNPQGETVDTALVVEAPPAPAVVDAPVVVAAAEPVAPLPKTASDLGLIGLSGLMFLGAGVLFSGFLKKSV